MHGALPIFSALGWFIIITMLTMLYPSLMQHATITLQGKSSVLGLNIFVDMTKGKDLTCRYSRMQYRTHV